MNETTRSQGMRLLAAGCPSVHLSTVGHYVHVEPIQLGRLWDLVRNSGAAPEGLSTGMSSVEVIEALVTILENHYGEKGK